MTGLDDDRLPALAYVLAPTDLDDFFAHAFEIAPLHVARADGGYFANLFSRSELEALLHVAATVDGHVAMAKDGTLVEGADLLVERTAARSRYTGRPPSLVLDSRAIASRYESGHTLFVKDAGLFSTRLHALCNAIQRQTFIYVQANVYLTPPDQRGFGLHYDTHDTLVLQIEGTKTWRLREPAVQLPIESQPSLPISAGTASRTFELHAGDTLYVPRGFPHECTAGPDASLHVTLALLPVRTIELAEAALRIAAITDVELRRSLVRGWQDDAQLPARISAFLAERLRLALDENALRAARELVVNELFATTRAVAADSLADAGELGHIDTGMRVALRNDSPFLVRERGETIELVEAGKVRTLPRPCAKVIGALLNGAMTMAAIEALLPGSGIALVRLLVLDGLATILPS